MPSPSRTLTRALAASLTEVTTRGDGRELIGIEREWPLRPVSSPADRADLPTLQRICDTPLPAAGRPTIEPGGQIELSTQPASSVDRALDALHLDTAELGDRLRRSGLTVHDVAVDVSRHPHRILTAGRYAAMEEYFAAHGEAGTWMMCNTASTQLNISHHPDRPADRWRLAHQLGPVLVAAFANSPGLDSDGTRWESLRQAIWWSIAPTRTRPPCTVRPAAEAWLEYALAADVMLVRGDGDTAHSQLPGFSFEQWMDYGHEAGWPTADDFTYHLTTLFPPIRARGWLELRMIDALPSALLEVATVVTATALTVDAVMDSLLAGLPRTEHLWLDAARSGLAHPTLRQAATLLFDEVEGHLSVTTAVPERRAAVRRFADRFVAAGASPAQSIASDVLRTGFAPRLRPFDLPVPTLQSA